MGERSKSRLVFLLAIALFALTLAACGSTESPELEGTIWALLTLNGDPVVGDVPLTAEFAIDNQMSGNTGCNAFSGVYDVNGENISITPTTMTRAACPIDESSQQETDYLNALSSATTFEIRGSTLELRDGSGDLVAEFNTA